MNETEESEYNKNVCPVEKGRKHRMSKSKVSGQDAPKMSRYSSTKLCDSDIGCSHSKNKSRVVPM